MGLTERQKDLLRAEEWARLQGVFADLAQIVAAGPEAYIADRMADFNDKLADVELADELLVQLHTPVYLKDLSLEQLRAQLVGE